MTIMAIMSWDFKISKLSIMIFLELEIIIIEILLLRFSQDENYRSRIYDIFYISRCKAMEIVNSRLRHLIIFNPEINGLKIIISNFQNLEICIIIELLVIEI